MKKIVRKSKQAKRTQPPLKKMLTRFLTFLIAVTAVYGLHVPPAPDGPCTIPDGINVNSGGVISGHILAISIAMALLLLFRSDVARSGSRGLRSAGNRSAFSGGGSSSTVHTTHRRSRGPTTATIVPFLFFYGLSQLLGAEAQCPAVCAGTSWFGTTCSQGPPVERRLSPVDAPR